MRHVISVVLVCVGIIHLLPVVGVLSAARLETLYGLQLTEQNLLVLMRHRAVLFGIVGGILVLGAFQTQYRLLALIVGLISVISFLGLVWEVGEVNAWLRRVMWVDIAALLLLVVGVMLHSRG